MNVNQLINMVLKLFVRKAVNGGINAGMRKMSSMGKGQGAAPVMRPSATQSAAPMDAVQSKQDVRKARQAARAARQMDKM
ncbi:MAG: hypothetical protein B7X55_09225 [Rhodobacterales bacterium 34-62-10]|nr:MAG: hypothetical protein B7X55_09225 [Rhodobacterales bacterium 34-62-10]